MLNQVNGIRARQQRWDTGMRSVYEGALIGIARCMPPGSKGHHACADQSTTSCCREDDRVIPAHPIPVIVSVLKLVDERDSTGPHVGGIPSKPVIFCQV